MQSAIYEKLSVFCRTLIYSHIILTGSTHFCIGQGQNHMFNVPGSRSSMMSGSIVAGIRDNSAVYHNPGAIAFINNPSVSLSTDGYYLNLIDFKNAMGTGESIESSYIDTNPQMFSMIFQNKQRDRSWSIGILSKVANKSEMFGRVTKPMGENYYDANLDYISDVREYWFGLGWGKKQSERLGLGASLFVTYRALDYYNNAKAILLSNTSQILANEEQSELIRHRAVGAILKVGLIHYFNSHWKFGANLTTPRLNIPLFNKSILRREYIKIPLSGESSRVMVNEPNMEGYYQSPLVLEAGLEYDTRENTYALKLSYFSAVSPYNMLRAGKEIKPLQRLISPTDPTFYQVTMGLRSVTNVAIGAESAVGKGFFVLCGFRTDFNNLDNAILIDQRNDLVPTLNTWNLYHFSLGMTYIKNGHSLLGGLSYATGLQEGMKQMANFVDVNENQLLGVPNSDAIMNYNYFTLMFGYTYEWTLDIEVNVNIKEKFNSIKKKVTGKEKRERKQKKRSED